MTNRNLNVFVEGGSFEDRKAVGALIRDCLTVTGFNDVQGDENIPDHDSNMLEALRAARPALFDESIHIVVVDEDDAGPEMIVELDSDAAPIEEAA